MDISFSAPEFLLLTPLALIPFIRQAQKPRPYSSLTIIPADQLSSIVYLLIQLCTASVILLLCIGLAGPHSQQYQVQKIGTGAEIVLLLDRSASMNENFTGRYYGGQAKESKASIARDMLTELVQRRENDFFGLIAFSTSPIHILPLTQDKQALISGISASNTRGRGVTNIAPGLSMAFSFFDAQTPTGSRVILLVSDGAARIEQDTQTTLTQLFQQHKVILYWIYLRDKNSNSLTNRPKNANERTAPEYFLHQYFSGMGIDYQAFEAEDPQSLQAAIAEIEKLENKPLSFQQKMPREDLSGYLFRMAMFGLVLLIAVRWLEIKSESL